jgi:hypothetical protein
MKTDLAKELRKAATRSGLSMLQIAKRTKMPYASIHNFIACGRDMTLRNASKLCDLFALELRASRRQKGGR